MDRVLVCMRSLWRRTLYHRQHCLAALFIVSIASAIAGPSHAQIIYQDDFEAGVTGWSNNLSEYENDFSTYMGRFDSTDTTTFRIFTIPALTDRVVITFDAYWFDSWDDNSTHGFDRTEVEIDNVPIFSASPYNASTQGPGTVGTVDWQVTPYGGYSDRAWEPYGDFNGRVRITVRNPGSTIKLLIRTSVNQPKNDESAGYDNFKVEAFPLQPNVTAAKSRIGAGTGTGFDVPGEEILFNLDVESRGIELDQGSFIITEPIPSTIAMFTGNHSGGGGALRMIDLSTTPSGITCCDGGAMIAYSNQPGANPTFNYTPNGSFDPAVTAIRITPSGSVRRGNQDPVRVRFEWKGRIR